jgi:hypothetical protein
MKKKFIKCGNNIFSPSDIVAMSWCLKRAEDNCGVEVANYYTLIFKSPSRELTINGEYREIKEQVDLLKKVIVG